MPYVPYKNSTLLVPDGTPTGKHLFVILNDACPEGRHVMVNVTTVHEGGFIDPACVLEAGDHPFVKHKSFMHYRLAELKSAEKIGKFVDAWYYKPGEDADEELVARIIASAHNSDFIARRILSYIEENC